MYLATLWIVITSLLDYPKPSMIEKRNLCAFIFFSQGCKAVLEWPLLFGATSFYVTLILKTIKDIGWIALITFLIFIYIGSAMYML